MSGLGSGNNQIFYNLNLLHGFFTFFAASMIDMVEVYMAMRRMAWLMISFARIVHETELAVKEVLREIPFSRSSNQFY